MISFQNSPYNDVCNECVGEIMSVSLDFGSCRNELNTQIPHSMLHCTGICTHGQKRLQTYREFQILIVTILWLFINYLVFFANFSEAV